MVPGGRGVCHDSDRCVVLAEAKLTTAIAASQAASKTADKWGTQEEKRAAQLKHQFSDERRLLLRSCIEGKCGVSCSRENRTFCFKGCGRGVHIVSCLHLAKARATLGVFKCGECRAEEMSSFSCSPCEALVAEGDFNSVLELSTGAEGTAKGRAEFARLERLWVSHVVSMNPGTPVGSIVLPRHSEESFISWVRWIATEGDRARSFQTHFRSAAGALALLDGVENWTKSARVKAVVHDLSTRLGVSAVPDTHATRRILSIMFDVTLPKIGIALRKRSRALAALELMAAVRIGEAAGGGEGHGALANNLSFMVPVSSTDRAGEEFCELWIPDSKTCFPRYANFMGRSRGVGIDAADSLRALLWESRIDLDTEVVDGLQVETPNYWVLRVSLVDMSDKVFKSFRRAVTRCDLVPVVLQSKAILTKSKSKMLAGTLGEESKFVNMVGGRHDSSVIRSAKQYFEKEGFGTFLDIVPGPLFRATHGDVLSHMPLAVDSSYKHVIGALKEAWVISSKMKEDDLELDLEGLDAPKWAHHTFRRTADKIARDTLEETGCNKADIDDMFGWKQAERAKDMQTHYAGRRERSVRARLTMMI